jgi:hypothetical protein
VVLGHVERVVPAGLGLHVICDSSTRKTPATQRWMLAHPRVRLQFTPTYSSELNLIERWFAELTTKWLKRGTHRSVAELEQAIQSWIDSWNDNPRPFMWTRTADRSSTPSPPTASASATQRTRPSSDRRSPSRIRSTISPARRSRSGVPPHPGHSLAIFAHPIPGQTACRRPNP